MAGERRPGHRYRPGVEDRSRHLWAIQAKAYDPQYSITKHDIDTFLSASATAEFSFRLLIATTDLIGGNAKRTIDSQEKPVLLHMRSDLAASADVETAHQPADFLADEGLPTDPSAITSRHGEAYIVCGR